MLQSQLLRKLPKLMHSIQISIASPCTVDTTNMDRVQKGVHCSQCEKIVVDFTKMSDEEIIALFQQGLKGCGIFRKDQLDRELTIPLSIKRKSFGPKWILGLLLFFGWIRDGNAQQSTNIKTDSGKHPVTDTAAAVYTPDGTHQAIKWKNLRMDTIRNANADIITMGIYQYPPNSRGAGSIGGGRSTSNIYIIDGINIDPKLSDMPGTRKQNFWRRLKFWK